MLRQFLCFTLLCLSQAFALSAAEPKWEPLFPADGVLKGWSVRMWNDLAKTVDANSWTVKDGILRGSPERGNWLVSDKEYGDFELEYEFKLAERGNSGLALRAPLKGDPAFDGMELQMADVRYNPEAKDSEITGGIYRAIAPKKQVYNPTEWNKMTVRLQGNKLIVTLNSEPQHDLDLSEQKQEVLRHDGSAAPPVKDRPRSGHLGFQELSREGSEPVQIRGARIRELVKEKEE